MLWMERFALMFYFVINLLLFGFMWLLSSFGPEYHSDSNDLKNCFILAIVITLPFWLLFRAIDYIFGGPLRREIRRTENLIQRGDKAVFIDY